jgi:hypothetical protein
VEENEARELRSQKQITEGLELDFVFTDSTGCQWRGWPFNQVVFAGTIWRRPGVGGTLET